MTVGTILLCWTLTAAAAPAYEEELIFPLQPQHAHSSSIAECPNGDLLACWFQGSGERRSGDVQILGARRKAGESEWSAPFPMADTPGFPDCNPVLFINSAGELRLFWIAVPAERWEDSLLRYRIAERDTLNVALSDDEGETWKWQRHLEREKGGQFHYPFALQSRDGRIHVSYTYNDAVGQGRSIKHATFNPEWVEAGDAE